MPIVLNCPHCDRGFRVRDESAGKRVRCPHCGQGVATDPPEPERDAVPATDPPPVEAPPVASVTPVAAAGPAGRRRAAGWRAFARGCRWVQVGLYLELAAFTLLVLVIGFEPVQTLFDEIGGLPRNPRGGPGLRDTWGPFAFAPYLLLLTAGTAALAFGRVRMAALPPGTGARGLMAAVAGFGALRLAAVAAAAALVLLAGVEWLADPGGWKGAWRDFLIYAVLALMLAWLAGAAVDFAVLPGMAVVGGAMSTPRLRFRAATAALGATFALFVWLVLWFGLLYLGALDDVFDEFGMAPRNPWAPRRSRVTMLLMVVPVLLVGYAVQVVLTVLYSSLYAAGRAAAAAEPGPPG